MDHPVVLDSSDTLQATVQLPLCPPMMAEEEGQLNLGPDLDLKQCEQLLTLLHEYMRVFAFSMELGNSKVAHHHIDTGKAPLSGFPIIISTLS